MHYVLFYSYVPDMLERRGPYREAHLALAKAAQARGELVLAGAYADHGDGAVLLFKGEDTVIVKDFVTRDPYCEAGLVADWNIRPLNVAIGG